MGIISRIKSDAKRWQTAAVLLAAVALVGVFHSLWVVGAFLTIVFIVASKEAIALYGLKNARALWIATILAWFAAIFYARPIEAIVVAILIAASFAAFDQKRDLKIVLPFLYPAAPLIFLFSLYAEFGISAYVWLLTTVVACDAGAYYAGKTLGKTPFSPSSPNKTIEGAAGGVTAGTILGSIAGCLTPIGFWTIAAITIAVSAASIFGDLFESYLKRKANAKDSGNILPGHGGVLDRIDGYLFAGVILLFALRLAS
jgi:phosphatidate cytidylyltransferase